MTADAPHFTPPRSAGTPEPGHDLKSAPMPELEEELGYSPGGLSQAEAANRCGVTQPRINDLLRGRVSRFSLDALVNIATALGCRVRVDLEAA